MPSFNTIDTGDIEIVTGSSLNADSGSIILKIGDSLSSKVGDIVIDGGFGQADGTDIIIVAGK